MSCEFFHQSYSDNKRPLKLRIRQPCSSLLLNGNKKKEKKRRPEVGWVFLFEIVLLVRTSLNNRIFIQKLREMKECCV